ncbi:NAD(P)/FAD-dependent oxidoreductase [Nocardia sp. IFM 10818]
MTSPARRRSVESFTGPQIHCTRWRDEVPLTGRSVAVIGSGAAVARVLPPVVDLARKVTVFQHDPVWVLPWPELPGARELVLLLPDDLLGSLPAGLSRHSGALSAGIHQQPPSHPGYGSRPKARRDDRIGRLARLGLHRVGAAVLRRVATANLRVQVPDPWQRRQLTPDMTAGVRLHNHYYRALRRPSCKLVTWPVARLAPLGVRTVDGIEHRVDLIIHAEDIP